MNRPFDNTLVPDVMVGITTYAGNFETRQILHKMLRHFRWQNGSAPRVVLFSDGPVTNPELFDLVDEVHGRPGPSGLQAGELESLRSMVLHAQARGARTLVKLAGDVIMNRPQWLQSVLAFHRQKGRPLLSTHWFHDDSWVVGTKFFVADVDFLARVLPKSLDGQLLEVALTESIRRLMPIEEAAWLINSNTGEAHEVKEELALWHWEHAHRLYKFRHLDDPTSGLEKLFDQALLYPALRLGRGLERLGQRLVRQ